MKKIYYYGLFTLLLGYALFNRNPIRNIPIGNNFTAPADGTIVDITNNRIEIFIGITDVHYQRSPFDGIITKVIEDNPLYNVIELDTPLGYTIIERWAGDLARTIITYVKIGDNVKKGQIIGRILLGSHTAITIPPELMIKVNIGDHIIAGETIIAE